MIDLTGITHHPVITEMVDVLCAKTQNTDRGFFNVEAAFFVAKIAATQRAVIVTKDRGEIPVNLYALALATSGYGKGHSVNIIENEFMKGFQKRFVETPSRRSRNSISPRLPRPGHRLGTEDQIELEKLERQFKVAHPSPSTAAQPCREAASQWRAGRNRSHRSPDRRDRPEPHRQYPVLTLFLELFDQGMVKRSHQATAATNVAKTGRQDANMLLFSTEQAARRGNQRAAVLRLPRYRLCRAASSATGNINVRRTQDPADLPSADSADQYEPDQQMVQPLPPARRSGDVRLENRSRRRWHPLLPQNRCEAADKLKEHEEVQAELSHRSSRLSSCGAFANGCTRKSTWSS